MKVYRLGNHHTYCQTYYLTFLLVVYVSSRSEVKTMKQTHKGILAEMVLLYQLRYIITVVYGREMDRVISQVQRKRCRVYKDALHSGIMRYI